MSELTIGAKRPNCSSEQSIATPRERYSVIDRFRGLAIFCMIFFQAASHFPVLGVFSRIASHDVTTGIVILPGMTIADIIAPMFVFAIGLTYKLSFDSRVERFGKKATYTHFALRYLALLGLGSVLDTINKILSMLGGTTLNVADYIFLSLFGVIALFALTCILCNIPKLEKHKKLAGKMFLYAMAVMGVFTLAVALRDFIALNADISAQKYGYWVVLQSLGFAGLITLAVIAQKLWVRFGLGLAIFIGYSIYHATGHTELVDVVAQGGFFGGFGWASILIFTTVAAELYFRKKRNLYICIGVLIPVAVAAGFLTVISKGAVSPGFILVSLAICVTAFAAFDALNRIELKQFDFLAVWGKNPLLMYLLEFGFVGGITTLLPAPLINGAPVWLAIMWLALITGVLTTIAYLLGRNKKVIKL